MICATLAPPNRNRQTIAAGYAVLLPYTSIGPAMLTLTYFVEAAILTPIAAAPGDTVVALLRPDHPALLHTWRDGRLIRESTCHEHAVFSALLGLMNDDCLTQTLCVYEAEPHARRRSA